ncbi:Uracil-DNA glycosylase [Carnobacterium alterfunditum]|uniref:Uracil-DNA glycosylase n=1 Tax=Carnobacterium alterfunditum TaxID=28230 RepID=A0A1N6HZC1_9LACT|nr:uracil-DNA glycosylase [Carnobacterium alterfunditum]SIO25174.1 Uracil-DNA glycosylase [Carnobacterium alterfunditum]
MNLTVENDWLPILQEQTLTSSYKSLEKFLAHEYQETVIYPEVQHIWQAFEWTPYNEVKVVILGQDPYHGPHQAHGLSFSVLPDVKIPPSLANIYKELESDLGIPPANHGYLEAWAKQGVLLLNTVLTVQKGQAHSHKGKGWEELTNAIIKKLSDRDQPMVFILWGTPSIKKRALIDETKHVVLTSVHPSPLSAYRGFFGSKPFSKANEALIKFGEQPINWQLPRYIQ